MPGSSPGMMLRCGERQRETDSIFKQPARPHRVSQRSAAPIVRGAGCAFSLSRLRGALPRRPGRGSGAPEGASTKFTPCGGLCEARRLRGVHASCDASASRRSTAAFTGGPFPLGHPPSAPGRASSTQANGPAKSSEAPRRATVVSPGRGPEPPECEVTSLARRKPHPIPLK